MMIRKEVEREIKELKDRIAILESFDPKNSSRYPYTYACDWMRKHFNINSSEEASLMRQAISNMLELSDGYVARVFADAYINEIKDL